MIEIELKAAKMRRCWSSSRIGGALTSLQYYRRLGAGSDQRCLPSGMRVSTGRPCYYHSQGECLLGLSCNHCGKRFPSVQTDWSPIRLSLCGLEDGCIRFFPNLCLALTLCNLATSSCHLCLDGYSCEYDCQFCMNYHYGCTPLQSLLSLYEPVLFAQWFTLLPKLLYWSLILLPMFLWV